MQKKIQQYLLLHYPLIWNIRIIPMLAILAVLHMLFFFAGYKSAHTSFSELYHSWSGALGILYTLSVLVGILLLTGWLVFYNRNNGFRNFYPRKTIQVYMEWIMIFFITTGIASIPVTLTMGYLYKWQSVTSKNEAQKAMDVLQKANVLIPKDVYNYKFDKEYVEPIPFPEGTDYEADTLDPELYSIEHIWETNAAEVKGYIGASLLFYNNFYYSSNYQNEIADMDPEDLRKYNNQESVKRWLRNGEKDSIYAVMTAFDNLRKKHQLVTDFTPEQWLERIYNPPFFPVKGSTAIMDQECSYSSYDDYYTDKRFDLDNNILSPEDTMGFVSNKLPWLPYRNLEAGYRQILDCYSYNKILSGVCQFCLNTSLIISCFIFSFRITRGRSWLTAFIATGIMIFITFVLAIIFGEMVRWDMEIVLLFPLLAWIVIFITLPVKMGGKIKNHGNKGRSEIYMNLFIWLIPCIIPLLYFSTFACMEISNISTDDYFKEILSMFWINIGFVILALWPVSFMIRKWKSLGDQ